MFCIILKAIKTSIGDKSSPPVEKGIKRLNKASKGSVRLYINWVIWLLSLIGTQDKKTRAIIRYCINSKVQNINVLMLGNLNSYILLLN